MRKQRSFIFDCWPLFAAFALAALTVVCFGADQKPLVINPTTGRTEQMQSGNNLVVPGGKGIIVGNGSQVAPAVSSGALLVQANGTGTNPAIILSDTVGNVEMLMGILGTTPIIGSFTSHPLYLRTNNVDRVTIADTTGDTSFSSTTNATSKDAASLVLEGGLGVEKQIRTGSSVFFGGKITQTPTGYTTDYSGNSITNSQGDDAAFFCHQGTSTNATFAWLIANTTGIYSPYNGNRIRLGFGVTATKYFEVTNTGVTIASDLTSGLTISPTTGTTLTVSSTTDATSKDAASVVLEGGLGVEKGQYVGTFINAGTSILSVGPTSGIGYATGAGGTVTQVTTRATAVTLNKICGSITLVSAAGSAAWTSMTVNNSAVATTDTIRVCQDSGTDKYQTHVTAVGAGSFEITYATTGGTTTETPVFSFTVLKAVTN